MDDAVERAVAVIRSRFHEQLSLSDMAAEALFSPFHFSRMFRRATGVPPGRYLTAVRLFEAKRLLLTTSLSVADIACQIGYTSVGTFTTKFTRVVGVSPTRYRAFPVATLPDVAQDLMRGPTALPPLPTMHGAPVPSTGHLTGTLVLPASEDPAADADIAFIGIFDDLVPQRPPVACTVLPAARRLTWRIDHVPAGAWVVMAVAALSATAGAPQRIVVGTGPSVSVVAGQSVHTRIPMRYRHPTDPPILLTVTLPRATCATVLAMPGEPAAS